MSIRLMTIVWDRFPEGGSKLLAMLALADWADDRGGRLYPSTAALAQKIRMSERQTKRLIEGLIETKFLTLLTEDNKGGRRKSNRYQVNLETLTNCPVVRGELSQLSKNSDTIAPENSDIAMSGEPLNTLLNERAPPERWDAGTEPRALALQQYIAQIERMPKHMRPPGEIERAKAELLEIAPETAQESLL